MKKKPNNSKQIIISDSNNLVLQNWLPMLERFQRLVEVKKNGKRKENENGY